jgi:hypothetical protein
VSHQDRTRRQRHSPSLSLSLLCRDKYNKQECDTPSFTSLRPNVTCWTKNKMLLFTLPLWLPPRVLAPHCAASIFSLKRKMQQKTNNNNNNKKLLDKARASFDILSQSTSHIIVLCCKGIISEKFGPPATPRNMRGDGRRRCPCFWPRQTMQDCQNYSNPARPELLGRAPSAPPALP